MAISPAGGVYVVDHFNDRVSVWQLPSQLTGQTGWYSLEDEELGDTTVASVNVADGNLLVKNEDLAPAKATSYVRLQTIYNSQAAPLASTLGPRWSWDAGPAVFLGNAGGSVVLHGPTGDVVTLTRQPDGSYTAPEEFEGTLTKNADGTFTLEGVEGITYQFSALGVMTGYIDEEGHVFSVANTTAGGISALHAVTANSSGKSIEVAYDATPHVTQTTDPTGKLRLYSYNAQGQLASFTEPSGAKTEYGYDVNGYLNSIKQPDGTLEIFTTVAGKVTEVTVTPKGKAAYGEKFSYQVPAGPTCHPESDVGETIVTETPISATSETETYCYDSLGEITGYTASGNEAEPPEGTELQEEVPAGTCYPDPEFPSDDCGQEDPPPENEEATSAALVSSIPDRSPSSYGISDNNALTKYNYFTKSFFKELHVVKVRRTVKWNLVSEAAAGDEEATKELADVRNWVESVKALGKGTGQPLISFDHCKYKHFAHDPTTPGGLPLIKCEEAPTLPQYKEAVRQLLADPVLGQVRYFTAWNEPNYAGEPLGKLSLAKRAGQYWRYLNGQCKPPTPKAAPRCFVGAGDFLDSAMHDAQHKNDPTGGGEYFHKYWEGMGHPTTGYRWAWHAYSDGENTWRDFHFRKPELWWRYFKSFRNAVVRLTKIYKPDIWLSEQGVRFSFNKIKLPAGKSGHKAQGIMRAFVEHGPDQLTRQSRLITAFYYYETRGEPIKTGNLDSGLVPAAGYPSSNPRRIYYIYKHKTPTS
jgi:YD repeat-containing protein